MNLSDNELIEAIFIEESKHRFIGKVLIDGIIQECHIPSSSRLETFIKLKGKRVLLTINKGQNSRTRYSLHSVFYRNKQIILNLNIVNELFGEVIKTGQYSEYSGYNSILRETTIQGYKADLFIDGDEKIIVENKAVIGVIKAVSFPTIFSERTITQLKKLNLLLGKGYKVFYNIVVLSPFIHSVHINGSEADYYSLLDQCICSGMIINGYSLYFEKNSLKSNRIQVYI